MLLLKPQHALCLPQVLSWPLKPKGAFPRQGFVREGAFGVKNFVREHFLTKENIKENILLKSTRSVWEEALSSSMLWVGFITV